MKSAQLDRDFEALLEYLKQTRGLELNHANAFLQSVFRSLHTGVVVLDARQNIISWNHRAEDLWGLRVEEVQGQPFGSLDIGLPFEKLRVLIRACLIGDSLHEETTVDATNRKGKAIKCRVTCSPIVAANKERQGTILMMEEEA